MKENPFRHEYTIDELCPFCEYEIKLKPVFEKQNCPNCNKLIKPCSLCDLDEFICNDCKLD